MSRLVEKTIPISSGFPIKPRLVVVPEYVAESAKAETRVTQVKVEANNSSTTAAAQAPVEPNK